MPAVMHPEQARLNDAYDVVAWNGLVIGSVHYAFHNGRHWCIAIQLTVGEPAWGQSDGEFEPFTLKYGAAPWAAPVAQPKPKWEDRRLDALNYLRIGHDKT